MTLIRVMGNFLKVFSMLGLFALAAIPSHSYSQHLTVIVLSAIGGMILGSML